MDDMSGKSIPIFVGRDKPMRAEQKQTAVHQYSVVKSLPHVVYPKDNEAFKSAISGYIM